MHCLRRHPLDEYLNKLPTLDEGIEAIQSLKKNKACELDGIPADVYKYGGDLTQRQLHLGVLKKSSRPTVFQRFSNNYHL